MMARPYVVCIKTTHPVNGTEEVHEVEVDAYELSEASMSVMIELDAKFALQEQGYKIQLLSARPNTARAKQQHEKALMDMTLAASAALGKKS